jgi:hypothetical protein
MFIHPVKSQLAFSMTNLKKLFFAALTIGSMALTGCLHIVEDVTFRNKGNGTYKMTIDMGELKGMMDMFKGMKPDSMATDSAGSALGMGMPDLGGDGNPMSQLGKEMTGVAATLKNIDGLSNIVEIADSNNFQFGYSFDFADVAALNRALKVVNKEKYDSKAEETFKFDGKSFERLGVGDIGAEMQKAMGEGGEGADEQTADMMKMFLGDMSYETIYRFPDRTIKKNSNELAELSDENHTLKIKLKPFDEEQQKKKAGIATVLKLK